MVTSDFKVKLVDMGFAIPFCGKDGSYNLIKKLGTPFFKAPELYKKGTYKA